MMKRENSESYGNNAPADAGVIAGLIAGYVDGRLKLEQVHAKTPNHNIYIARRDNGKLQIIGPSGKEVEDAMAPFRKSANKSQGGMSTLRGSTFTAHTLAAHLGWIRSKGDEHSPTDRFYTGFNVLTKLILPGAATPSELEGLNQRAINDVAEGTKNVADDVTKERQEAEMKAALTGSATKRLGVRPPRTPLTPRPRGRDSIYVRRPHEIALNPTHARARLRAGCFATPLPP